VTSPNAAGGHNRTQTHASVATTVQIRYPYGKLGRRDPTGDPTTIDLHPTQ